MRAMVLRAPGHPPELVERERPRPSPLEVLLEVRACGVCRTDLHIIDGELSQPRLPLVLGHQIIGTVIELGSEVRGVAIGARVGVTWLAWADLECRYCRAGQENLCARACFTGYQRDGGYADYCTADHRFIALIPTGFSDLGAAPLLCAGAIGYRALRLAGDAERLGLYGFGSAAHLLAQVARFEGRRVFAFTRPGDAAGQEFARALGAEWAGGSDESPPEELDAAIIFAPAGELVPRALGSVARGGVVVCGGIHMSDIPSFPYRLVWGERVLRSVANVTRRDARELLALAERARVQPEVTAFPLERAPEALARLRRGQLRGSAVLEMGSGAARLAGG